MAKVLENIDDELFINEIKENECIWNYSSELNSDKIKKDGAWRALCEKFDPDFNEKSVKEKNDIGKPHYARSLTITSPHTRSSAISHRHPTRSQAMMISVVATVLDLLKHLPVDHFKLRDLKKQMFCLLLILKHRSRRYIAFSDNLK
ncbi:unnamed protein product [Parnassius apollo]|uniref:(apollo) hypothetical protein n=1 Tax=Parnassius apollo TaxID=110799 RepID=A0A8S3W199_PARAO|nr:unnamed protein product [Parnassius apollo]